MAQQFALRNIDDVPPARRRCEHPEHSSFESAPVAAFAINMTSRNRILREGLYLCAEHAAVNERFVTTRIVYPHTPRQQCDSCLAFDGGHEETCYRREGTVPPSPAWSVKYARR